MYKIVKYGKFHERRNFAQAKLRLELPNLIENQLDSFKKFIDSDIQGLFAEVSPIRNKKDGSLELHLFNPRFDEPETTIRECKEKEISYTRALRCDARFFNLDTGDTKEQLGIFLADFPWMTPTGTFVINGAERVVVNQIIRSSGVLFKQALDAKTGNISIQGQVIPTRGAWIEYGINTKEILNVAVDRSNKVVLPIFLKAIGFSSHDEMIEVLGKNEKFIETLNKNPEKTYEVSMEELYGKIKSGDNIPSDAIHKYLRDHLMDQRRYDLMEVGRYKFNKKLDFVERARGHVLAKSYKISEKLNSKGEVVQEAMTLEKGTYIDNRIADIISNNRSDFRKVLELEHDIELDPEGKEPKQPTIIETIKVTANQPDDSKRDVVIVGSYFEESRQFITTSDMVAATSYWLNLLDNVGHFDDVDNLANRRLRLTGELLQNEFRQGLMRLEKNTIDKMSTTNDA